jgi:signal transduction histidine kinase
VLLSKTLQSSTLKLALIYVGVFSAAIFGLLFFVHRSTVGFLREVSDQALARERLALTSAFDRDGRSGLVSLIDRRLADPQFKGWYYLFADARFARVAGNLSRWPAVDRGDSGSSGVTEVDWGADHTGGVLRATWYTLPDGEHLLFGRSAQRLNMFTGTLTIGLATAAGLFLALATAAGISTARRSVTRIETINATSREIMREGLGRRIPLRGSGDEWDELAANLNSMLDRIGELVETNRQVSDNVAHDLRTPLTRMRARLERAATEPADPARNQALITDLVGELDDILRTFSSLLRISQIEASERMAGFRRLDLGEIAGEVAELFDAAAEDKAVSLSLSAPGPAPVVGDRDLLFDAISNLVDNALKHGSKGGEVRLSVAATAAGSVLAAADHGPGIPSAERQRVFRRFYRLERSRSSPGDGLGLSLVAAVANLHDARIEIADNDPGIRIELHFPPVPETA